MAKAYRLVWAVLNTAVGDELIRANPCRIKGADREPTPERPVATVDQVFRLADLMPTRYRALVLFAAFVGLRWGEIIALRRCDLDLEAQTVRVHRSFVQMSNGEIVVGPPKSVAGTRTVALPGLLLLELRTHLQKVSDDGEALIFTGAKGAMLRRSNFRTAVRWADSTEAVELRGFTFHDLRHTGNTLAAASGASTRELMHRMGHDSVRAALIYQHATNERDREVADAMNERIRSARNGSKRPKKAANRRTGQ